MNRVSLQSEVLKYKVVIFDLDGTLYDLRKAKKSVSWAMLKQLVLGEASFKEIYVVFLYRKIRKQYKEGVNLLMKDWALEQVAHQASLPSYVVRSIVEKWLFDIPCSILYEFREPGIVELLNCLRLNDIVVAVLSDYPAQKKLEALQLEVDVIVDSENPNVNALKPSTKGLKYLLDKLDASPDQCLMVGDREDKDGECARRLGIPFILYNPKKNRSSTLGSYFSLLTIGESHDI